MLLLTLFFCAVAQAQLQVSTTEGTVEGVWVAEGNYNAFYGVPYAGNVDGTNRFKAAPSPTPFVEVFRATRTDIRCAQPSERGLIGEENCLTLNIFTQNVTTTSRPVLVWLNAEEYTRSPSNLPSFRNFIDQGLVVVTLNFRLSVYGFLCLGVEQAPGNAGIKDIVQGLQWVNRNIASFGGNPDNVLLMGHGSAAALVDIVTMVPRANNLVHKAITLSGSVLAPWAIAYTPVQYAEALGQKLGYSGLSQADLASRFASTTNDVLLAQINSFSTFTNNTPLFAPCIENSAVSGDESVLTDLPINILKAGSYNHVPYLAAYVTEEGTIRAEQAVGGWLQQMQTNFSNFLPADLDFGDSLSEMSSSIRNRYFGLTTTLDMSNVRDFLAYQGDTLVMVPVIRGARERAATSKSDVRLMQFGFMGTLSSEWSYPQIELMGVKHGGIINYFYGDNVQPTEERAVNSLVSRIVAFANNGVPVGPTSAPPVWPQISSSRFWYLEYIGSAHAINPLFRENLDYNPHSTYVRFWDEKYFNYSRAFTPFNFPSESSPGSSDAYKSKISIGLMFLILFSRFNFY